MGSSPASTTTSIVPRPVREILIHPKYEGGTVRKVDGVSSRPHFVGCRRTGKWCFRAVFRGPVGHHSGFHRDFSDGLGETVRKGVWVTLRAWILPVCRGRNGVTVALRRLLRSRFGHLRDFSDSFSLKPEPLSGHAEHRHVSGAPNIAQYSGLAAQRASDPVWYRVK